MYMSARHEFVSTCDSLSRKAKRAFLAGMITLAEAKEFSTRSRLENTKLSAKLDLLHTKRHDPLLRKHTDIAVPHEDASAFADELDHMPEHIVASVMEGRITLVQARFAVRDRIGTKGVFDLARANTPTLPYRERKFRLGTERSVRAPIVRVRTTFAHVPSRRK